MTDWTAHKPGARRPCPEDASVSVKFRNGHESKPWGGDRWRWTDTDHDFDIVAWRIEG